MIFISPEACFAFPNYVFDLCFSLNVGNKIFLYMTGISCIMATANQEEMHQNSTIHSNNGLVSLIWQVM